MTGNTPARSGSELGWLLDGLIRHTPGAHSALLLSGDGLPVAVRGQDPDQADRLAAIASGLLSASRAADRMFGGPGQVRQVAVQLSATLLYVMEAGDQSVLALAGGENTDPGVAGHQMAQLVEAVRPCLATPARPPAPAAGQP